MASDSDSNVGFTAGWVENTSSQWPAWADALLKRYMAETRILEENTSSKEYPRKLQDIGVQLLSNVNPYGWEPRHGELFWQKIQRMVAQYHIANQHNTIRTPVYRDPVVGDTIHLAPDSQNRSKLPPAKAWGTPPVPSPKVPTTQQSVLNKDDLAAKIWKEADTETQLRIFRAQLWSTKVPTALMHEIARFCAEMCRKGDTQTLSITSSKESPKVTAGSETKGSRVASNSVSSIHKISNRPILKQSTDTQLSIQGQKSGAECESREQSRSGEETQFQDDSSSRAVAPVPDLKSLIEERLRQGRLKRAAAGATAQDSKRTKSEI
ncbi:uncharacterized protein LY89DRAFT_779673 [Mollisia scopiformis]|uniref:Uncharacterized protein n=1 Tax=Mollisia scopiformis TaxID=149040 RepID=A0A194XJ37_MOLSC|nr:uncharacterized protein LY89DRAFT_779673 [Mollisia scopiformis]KUJ19767.1 hypothetical protein LY89DRAFT_779673 [Mollisia scopiformis]